ncbi:coenzyme F420-0:L-glutamate ligase [Nocardioides gansuensis]|uniref:Coenzyme F420-0:L-glutamate ligase n=1 Tax=Nocardioides gansuensis TaxID=2138300 RepID=A0A2T8F519_9ACTN|nr:coenzyme F420-0:L-glutamate ligase [Nocardioides gansuensis]PVG80818.1 coenzyme F420-0:L-glutamate ligase [Nocardioides gansuensis]
MTLTVTPVNGIGEVSTDTDLVQLVGGSVTLQDGDLVVVTSKIVSKAEGRVVRKDRAAAVAEETVRTVARRGATVIVENHLGLVMAAAGVDASNVEPGTVALLPRDPDASARSLREGLHRRFGRNVAVIIADTAGRPWRHGQTDIAIGVAGVHPLDPHTGLTDGYGNELSVTMPAIADEIAGVAEVASGKLGRRPVVVVRGLDERVLASGVHGPGAAALVRARGEDMFGLGAREAVVAALSGGDPSLFGTPADQGDLVRALDLCGFTASQTVGGLHVAAAADDARLQALILAYGWRAEALPSDPGAAASMLRPRA